MTEPYIAETRPFLFLSLSKLQFPAYYLCSRMRCHWQRTWCRSVLDLSVLRAHPNTYPSRSLLEPLPTSRTSRESSASLCLRMSSCLATISSGYVHSTQSVAPKTSSLLSLQAANKPAPRWDDLLSTFRLTLLKLTSLAAGGLFRPFRISVRGTGRIVEKE